MDSIGILDIININQSVLKNIDNEIVKHGNETAYIAYMIAIELGLSDKNINYLLIASLIHDIGAYKIDELKGIKQIDIENDFIHPICGYSIVSQNKILSELGSYILYHHHSYKDKDKYIEGINILEESFIIGLADRVSIIICLYKDNINNIKKNIYSLNKDNFKKEHIEKLFYLVENKNLIEDILDNSYVFKLKNLLLDIELDSNLIKSYLIFFPLSIDFFSFETSLHTVRVARIAKEICDKIGLDKSYKEKIEIASYLHDIGKVYTPKRILEKNGKLSDEEFEIMKKHVYYSEMILKEANIDKELISLACNHHEKLDGSGYTRGLKESELSVGDKIISISDIFCALTEKRHYKKSFNKNRVIEILNDMTEKNYIDKSITGIIINNYEYFLGASNEESEKYEGLLNEMLICYKNIYSKLEKLKNQ